MEAEMQDSHANEVVLEQIEKFQFRARFGGSGAEWVVDEPEPIGKNVGPSPEQLVTAGVANCLSDSLMFALSKFRQDPSPIRTVARARVGRNDANRLRILAIDVEIRLGKPAASLAHLERALNQFENFCTVASSISTAVPVNVTVYDSEGVRLKDGDTCLVAPCADN